MDIKYPIIYKEEEQLFQSYGLAILQNAYEIEVNRVLNGEYTLSFSVPLDSKLKSVIGDAYWVKCNETIFSIMKIEYTKDGQGTTTVRFNCEHISFSLRNGYVNFAEYAGQPTQAIVQDLLGFMPNPSRFLYATWMVDTDNQKFEFRNKNVYECFKDICDKIGAEIDFDLMPDNNGKFRIGVRQPIYNDNTYIYEGGGVGSIKPDIQIRDRKNIRSLKKEVDKSNVLTKLHVFGKGGGTFQESIIAIQADGSTPLVPPIVIPTGITYFEDNLAIERKVGFVQFNDIDDKVELYWAGKAKWEELQRPRINYDIEIVDLRFLSEFKGFDTFQVGDVVTFIDTELTENEKQQVRVTEYKCYPLEPEKNTAVFSSVKNTVFYTFADFYKQAKIINTVADSNGKVKVASLEKVYVETSEVIVDTVNTPYNGVFVINGYYDGTIYSGDTQGELNRSALFFPKPDGNVGSGVDGGVILYNKIGAGIAWGDSDTVPMVRYGGSGIKAPILTNLNDISDLLDVEVVNPTPAQILMYDVVTGKWKNQNQPLPVFINNPQNGQVLKFNSSSGFWENSF